jgi:hypothetical protein
MWRTSLKMQALHCQSDFYSQHRVQSRTARLRSDSLMPSRPCGAGWVIFNETELIEHPDDRCEGGDYRSPSADHPGNAPTALCSFLSHSRPLWPTAGRVRRPPIQTKSRSQSEVVEQIVAIAPIGQLAERNPAAGSAHLICPPKPGGRKPRVS